MKLNGVGSRSKSLVLIAAMAAIIAPQGVRAQETNENIQVPVLGPVSTFLAPQGSLDRLRGAYESVRNNSLIKSFFGQSRHHALSIAQRITGQDVETTKFQHYFDGLEVIGSKTFHHLGRAGTQVRNVISRFDLDTQPGVDVENAISIARGYVGDRGLSGVPTLKVLPMGDDGSARLIYWVVLAADGDDAGRDVLVDAHSGEVIASISHNISIAPIQVYLANTNIGLYPPPGTPPGGDISDDEKRELMKKCQVMDQDGQPLMVNVKNCPMAVKRGKALPGADASALRAAANSKAVLNYFQQTHRRNSYNGRGAEVVSVVHIGNKFDNAFWSSDLHIMAYGDGNGVETKDFTYALDVAGHEMTHGLISETADLIYMDESGALNEAYADFFGKMIANDGDWAMGRKLFVNPKNDGFRDMANPGKLKVRMRDSNGQIVSRPYPSKISERFPKMPSCDDSNDYCWVHVNATIPGHASYLVTQAIGKQKAERLYYLTLTQYLNERSNFAGAAKATLSACSQIFDAGTCGKVKTAFAQVGL